MFTIEDLSFGSRFGFNDAIRFGQIRDVIKIGGETGEKAYQALEWAKEWFLGLMRFDGGWYNDWLNARARGVEPTPPNWMFQVVEDHFEELCSHIDFMDFEQIGKSKAPHIRERLVARAQEHPKRAAILEWFKKWDSSGGEDANLKPYETVTLGTLADMKWEELKKLAKEHGISARNKADFIKHKLAEKLGLLDDVLAGKDS